MSPKDSSTSSSDFGPSEIFFRIAPYYDELMRFIGYPGWIRYLSKIFRHFGRNPCRILDMACGTGNVAIPLAENGFKLIGLDRSPTMLAELRKKDKTRRIQLICADMRDFSLPEPVDACICLFDSLNYLLTIEELASCFCSVRNSLKPDGIFIFDMNTLYCLANYWSNQVSVREFGDVYSIWQSRYDPERHISTLYLTLFVRQRNHKYKRFEEVHKERGYELSEIRENLNRAGFPKVNIYHHLTFEPPTPLTSRVMVVAEPYVSDLG